LHISFEKDTSFEQIVELKKQMQAELDDKIGDCNVNIIVEDV
jgi:hypothetical protein